MKATGDRMIFHNLIEQWFSTCGSWLLRLNEPFIGVPKTIEKHRHLHYSYKVATNNFMVGCQHNKRNSIKGHSIRKVVIERWWSWGRAGVLPPPSRCLGLFTWVWVVCILAEAWWNFFSACLSYCFLPCVFFLVVVVCLKSPLSSIMWGHQYIELCILPLVFLFLAPSSREWAMNYN